MTERRFTDKAELDPASVRGLPDFHPAMVGNRTLFPTTVVTVTAEAPDNLLVSGRNNRKLGETITKGRFAGYALYGLTLEERATCPGDCHARGFCYGNGVQLARRHRIGDAEVFYDRLGAEIAQRLADHPEGVMIRLHVLGDFPSVEYVAFWSDMLAEHEKLACYGYTARRTKAWDGDEIGDAIQAVKDQYPDRFRIRWSSPVSRPDGAFITDRIPEKPRVDEGLVCPNMRDATSCCASCALCWEPAAKHDTIVFIKHGPTSLAAAADVAMRRAAVPAPSPASGRVLPALPAPVVERVDPLRAVAAIQLPAGVKPRPGVGSAPELRYVRPSELHVEAAYQRDLSPKSIKLIRRIVAGFDWAKLKPPIAAETADGLFVIDGQHTAIAAATHPEIEKIPVLVVEAEQIERRADAFVAHNRDRVAMSALQVFHAEVAAGNQDAVAVMDAIRRGGGSVPRLPPAKGYARPGQIVAVNELRRMLQSFGPEGIERVVRIAVKAGLAPVATTAIIGLRVVCNEPRFAEAAALGDDALAAALASITNLEATANAYGAETGQNRYRACACLIERAAQAKIVGVAA
ncbi:MAG TPA: hypothetical protein VM434_18530 [Beijerinckiaceae bacterium]|nr:hypothetical protein [Beijerinckiaceae bacterium]